MIQVLRVVHIYLGVFWVGSVLFMAAFLMPSARAIGPAAGPMMNQLTQVRSIGKWLMLMGTLTIISGFWMYYIDSMGFSSEWLKTNTAKVFGLGGVFALITWVIGLTGNAPTANKLGKIMGQVAASGAPPTPEVMKEIQALQMKLGKLVVITAITLSIATLCMALARYIG